MPSQETYLVVSSLVALVGCPQNTGQFSLRLAVRACLLTNKAWLEDPGGEQRLLPPDGPPRPCGVRGPPSRLRQLHPPPLVRLLEWPAGGTGGDAGRYLPGCTQIGEALPAGEPLPELPRLYGVPASGLLRRHFTITR